jgi:choline dehydrogenase
VEVFVSLGAIQTPKLLMQSGIGDQAELRAFDIPVVENLPGVGRNLHDHVALGCIWEAAGKSLPRRLWRAPHSGPLAGLV